MQVKLLRVLQEKTFERVGGNRSIDVDVKIITATNQNIREKIISGDFRVELFYRLNVVPIHIPPLRERIEDIPLLVKHFIGRFHEDLNKNIQRISARAMGQLMRHPWPGNVRELENVLERAFVTTDGDTIDNFVFSHEIPDGITNLPVHDVDISIPFTVARSMVVRQFEKSFLSKALRQYNGNVSRTAKKIGINQRTLWRKIKQYGLDTNSGKQRLRTQ
jgi:DNA-binding NtrC family response regulator